jgi:uncharacterized membrane protein YvbJ
MSVFTCPGCGNDEFNEDGSCKKCGYTKKAVRHNSLLERSIQTECKIHNKMPPELETRRIIIERN